MRCDERTLRLGCHRGNRCLDAQRDVLIVQPDFLRALPNETLVERRAANSFGLIIFDRLKNAYWNSGTRVYVREREILAQACAPQFKAY